MILIERIEGWRRTGKDVCNAVLDVVRARFCAIKLTALSTVLGLTLLTARVASSMLATGAFTVPSAFARTTGTLGLVGARPSPARPSLNPPRTGGARTSSPASTAGVEARRVGGDIGGDGNSFQSSRSVDKKRVVGDGSLGGARASPSPAPVRTPGPASRSAGSGLAGRDGRSLVAPAAGRRPGRGRHPAPLRLTRRWRRSRAGRR